jgi:hypothetical protein
MPTNDALDPAELQAGSELDAEIARRVFGFWYTEEEGWGPQWWGPHPVTPDVRAYAACTRSCEHLGGDSIDSRNGLPRFSTDIAAAWLIVEAIPSCCFRIDREKAAGIRYDATIIMDGEQPYDHGRQIHATASTAPLAICRAALSAVAMASEGEQ